MDAIVQLIRNALCCIKDLEILEGSFLHDAATTRAFLGAEFLPEPLNKTTPLEIAISITQAYAFLSVSRSGMNLMTTSVGKLRRIVRLVEGRLTQTSANHTWTHADRIVSESMFKEAKFALRSAFIGFLLFPLGLCFLWLTANSWHVTETNWIGGVPALIYALIVMEIALVPLLYFMIVDGFEMLAKSKRCQDWMDIIDSGKASAKDVGIYRYEVSTGWVPFWDAGVSIFAKPAENEEELVQKEVQKVKDTLATWFPEDKKKGEKEEKLSKEALEDIKEKLEEAVPKLRWEGYREFLYFVFNFVAFYGYLMGPLTYYYQDELSQPYHVQSLKMFYSNSDADWTGNFAGDLMWTIEPMVVLGSPFLLHLTKPAKKNKLKSD